MKRIFGFHGRREMPIVELRDQSELGAILEATSAKHDGRADLKKFQPPKTGRIRRDSHTRGNVNNRVAAEKEILARIAQLKDQRRVDAYPLEVILFEENG